MRYRWILAFDASCATCAQLSASVATAAGGRLEVLPLADPIVHGWLHDTVGPDVPWEPTLIKVAGDAAVRSWSGRRMTVPLVRHLGPRATARVITALSPPIEPDGFSRKTFLRFTAGAAAAAGLLLNGMTTAGANTKDVARAWVAANRDRLPQTYDAVIGHSMVYRKAIWDASAPAVRSGLWVAQFSRYRVAHPKLTPAQRTVLADAIELAADESVFANGATVDARVPALRDAALAAFDRTEGKALFATLGPDENTDPTVQNLSCQCSTESDWCESTPNDFCWYKKCDCIIYGVNCGTLWQYECDGICVQTSC